MACHNDTHSLQPGRDRLRKRKQPFSEDEAGERVVRRIDVTTDSINDFAEFKSDLKEAVNKEVERRIQERPQKVENDERLSEPAVAVTG